MNLNGRSVEHPKLTLSIKRPHLFEPDQEGDEDVFHLDVPRSEVSLGRNR
jgi:hypothetical protein